ncbi:MAG TPA: hypothetical protein EYH01_08955 [Campylobacterales bacterium]|nr:hypothetical protein [Campylobacterales bacterium]HIP60540.1 hypothetical protein [Campylobacterales bacterium]
MKKTLILLCAATSFILATDTPVVLDAVKINKSVTKVMKKKLDSPFLILGKMPHLTKTVKENWDSPLLELTDAQKEKLLKVRKTTMTSITKLKKEIFPLEKEVAKATMAGDKPDSLKAKVEKLSKLKAEATMVHIKCIYETKKILDAKQLAYLLK